MDTNLFHSVDQPVTVNDLCPGFLRVAPEGGWQARSLDGTTSVHRSRMRATATLLDRSEAIELAREAEAFYNRRAIVADLDAQRTAREAAERQAREDACSSHYVVKGTDRLARVADALPALEAAEALDPEAIGYYEKQAREHAVRTLARLAPAREAAEAAWSAVRTHEEGYTGWSRFWLVTSSAGHVHSSMDCSSCRRTTTYAPVPSLSASTEAEAVETLGETLCTVCFPSAPVKPSKITQAQAVKLVEEGEEAFRTMRAKALAKKR